MAGVPRTNVYNFFSGTKLNVEQLGLLMEALRLRIVTDERIDWTEQRWVEQFERQQIEEVVRQHVANWPSILKQSEAKAYKGKARRMTAAADRREARNELNVRIRRDVERLLPKSRSIWDVVPAINDFVNHLLKKNDAQS
jgi:AcrR family transcriptional regulator